MKLLSFNCRGFASSAKKLALRRLLTSDRLDIIFLQETLCQADHLIHLLSSWLPNWNFDALDASGRSGGLAIGSGGLSDHRPIFLEVNGLTHKTKSPFKFNASWLQDPSFIQLVHEYWQNNPIREEEELSAGFVRKLTELKQITKNWAHQKRIQDNHTLNEAERIITEYKNSTSGTYNTPECKEQYNLLLTKRSQILKEREESMRLRSRAILLTEGDNNTKFYHKFANGWKAINTIWELKDQQGHTISNQQNLARLATDHFRGIYKAPGNVNILEIMRVAELFPRYVDQENMEEILKEVTMDELEATLKWFKKDKSPGPDGWTIEFYISFFDILGQDLLRIVEDSRRRGRISSAIKSTFIALIPKTDNPISFDDFRPISLCNCLYKIIAKIIANRLKPILSQHISSEQFAFLHHRQIHEAIATAQKLMHTLQIKKQKGMILKVDLSKAFDRTNWLYLRMLLTHLGFPYDFIKWMMSCITDVSYSVLLNGEATTFFTAERGLRQGCPLSPLLFLLIMEGLSRIILSTRDRHQITGIKIVDNFFLTHLLFVDDILIFLNGSIGDTSSLHNSFLLFQQATGMQINNNKSTITSVGCSVHEITYATQRFPFVILELNDGIKYLGFRLKPSGYKIADWLWLISKVEKRLQVWYHKYLSRAGRLVLIKAVIEATPVYWMALAWIPRGILNRLQNICCRFLWKGHQPGRIYAWVKWETISKPKCWGGWGIKRLATFSKALAAKLGWSLLTADSLWTRVAFSKYIKPLSILDWICTRHGHNNHFSNIWKAVIESIPLLRDGITWRIKEGNAVRIGMDPWVGCGNSHRLPADLIHYLHDRGIMHIKHIGDQANSSFLQQAWLSARALGLPNHWTDEWKEFTSALTQAQIRLTEGLDEIIWAHAKHGVYTPKLGYIRLMDPHKPPDLHPTWKSIWKFKAAPRTRLLMWNIIFDKIPTGSNLMKRSFNGPFRCHLCLNVVESTEQSISTHIPHLKEWHGNNLQEAWTNWCLENTGKAKNLPLLICWAIWIARNQSIFQLKLPHWPSIILHTVADYNLLPDEDLTTPPRTFKPIPIDHTKPWAFFDGSAQDDGCGGGAILHINDRHCYKIQFNLGRGTNNFAELSSAKHIIHFAILKHCRHLQIFGDSKVVCNWLNNASHCHAFALRHILDEAKRIITSFESFVCHHIYSEQNTIAD
eukprot:PITA_33651